MEHVQSVLRSSWLVSQCAHGSVPLEAPSKTLLWHIVLEILDKQSFGVPIRWARHCERALSPDADIDTDST